MIKRALHILLACAVLFSCTEDIVPDIIEQPERPVQEGVKTYTLAIIAGKGERQDTKALDIDGTGSLNATWTKGDTVRVYNGVAFLGNLIAQADGQSTTLKGQITGAISKDDVLTLKFLGPDYTLQDGTIEYIASHCDYAQASVTVTNVEEAAVTTTSATFANPQAIVKFTLNVSAKPLSITLPDQCIAVTPSSAQSVLYVALPALSSQPVSLMAAADEKIYVKSVASVTLEAGKYYAITANLAESASDLLVHNEAELRAAVQKNNVSILFANNISTTSLLEIKDSRTVTINLGGYMLDRGCKSRGSQAIVVRTGSTLNLSGGTVTGGWGGHGGALDIESGTTVNLTNVTITGNHADDRGGGISNRGTLSMTGGSFTNNESYDHTSPGGGGGLFNYEGATATLTSVTFTGNEAWVCGGGGIYNHGTLYLDGVTIQHNTAGSAGGGIYSCNKKDLLKIQGANIITDNTAGGVPSNLFMEERRWITLTGSITGSRIGITLDVAPNQFTDEYATYHNGVDPNTFFTCDRPETDYLDLIPNEQYVLYVGEVILKKKALDGKVPYIERSWDSENKKVVFTTKILTEEIKLNATPTSETQYKRLASSPGSYLDLGTENSTLHEYYVVSDEEVKFESLIVKGPNVHIILCDNAWLHLNSAVGVERGDLEKVNTVYFHAQSSGPSMGKMTSGSIGGSQASNGANIEIHGGDFDLQGNTGCAAIGGKYDNNGTITIFDGKIKAIGGDDAAGIGGGYMCADYGKITIYGGSIDATGSAGIGGGNSCINGKLTIWGGNIIARGRDESAGIGSNQNSGDYGAGTITINGGTVRAYGDKYGAGIGGGDGIRGGTVNVNGGHVEAYGGTDAAGIGGGEGGNGGIVNITGGYVYAQGGWEYGAGIGGGQDGAGADVTINGGTVIVKAGQLGVTGLRGIGPGTGSNDYGKLTLGDNMMVSSWNGNEGPYPADSRKDYCWYRTQARIEPCTHPGHTAEDCPYHKH